MHRAYAKHAEVNVPSLGEWEKDWQDNSHRGLQPTFLPLDCLLTFKGLAGSN